MATVRIKAAFGEYRPGQTVLVEETTAIAWEAKRLAAILPEPEVTSGEPREPKPRRRSNGRKKADEGRAGTVPEGDVEQG